jgi:hypothetical protein
MDAQWKRIEAIVGSDENMDFGELVHRFYEHLCHSLDLPFEVTGTEDFRWEEGYVLGVGSEKEWKRLRQNQPSYQDRYELQEIEYGIYSDWMLFQGEDIGAHVKRKSDGKEFVLGLAELKAVDRKSRNAQLLNDYAVFFVNSR